MRTAIKHFVPDRVKPTFVIFDIWASGAVVYWLARSTIGRGVTGSSRLAAGCRVATVGQLLFAPWAWAYSTLHPLGVGK